MSLSHCCGGILAHSSLQNCFNSVTLEGFQAWKDCLRSRHSSSIGFKPGLWLGHSKTLLLFFLCHSEVDLLLCLGSLSRFITQVRLSLRSQTDGRTFFFRIFWLSAEFMVPSIMASHPGPEAAKQTQTITLPPPCLTVGMMFFYEMLCWFYVSCNGTRTFQKVQLLSHQSTEHLPKSLGDNQDIIWQMWDEPLCSFGQQWLLPWNSSHGCCFCPVSFLLLNREHWP